MRLYTLKLVLTLLDQPSIHLNFNDSALLLTLGVNDAIEINVLLSSINTSVKVRVTADVQCEYTLKLKMESKIQRPLNC